MSKSKSLSTADNEVLSLYDKAHIVIKGARTNNLKNIDLIIPKNKLIVVTGVSGSGKSSITMDTLYAEGQRRYVESLSSYARQFMTRIKKPDVDYIKGITPAIAIKQKVSSANARSTVGSMTEILDFLRLLYARIGKTISPITGLEVKKDSVSDVMKFLSDQPEGSRFSILSPFNVETATDTLYAALERFAQKGFNRVHIDGVTSRIDDLLESLSPKAKKTKNNSISGYLVVDRIAIKHDDAENNKRIADSIETAFSESHGYCDILSEDGSIKSFSIRFEEDGIEFEEPSVALFNFNSSFGACPACEGYGVAIGIDPDKVIPNKSLTLYDHAIVPWIGERGTPYYIAMIRQAQSLGLRIHTPYIELTEKEIDLLWSGNDNFKGIDAFFKELQASSYKIQERVILSRYRGRTICPTCKGKRLRKEVLYIKVADKDIAQLGNMDIEDLHLFFDRLKLSETDYKIAQRILTEINSRLSTMVEIGLGYLTLLRPANTLSGGETQRIHLTRLLGSNLTGSMYLLDEPSVGLHPRDTRNLVKALKKLRDLGNTVIVVEHEEEVIRSADFLVDMGPEAGVQGGEVVFTGNYDIIHQENTNGSLTLDYLTGRKKITVPIERRVSRNKLEMKGVNINNLHNVSVTIPLHSMVGVSGVSGSGKSSLIRDVLYPTLNNAITDSLKEASGPHILSLSGDIRKVIAVEMIDQQPIGKSSRSNPVTYVKAYDYIRDLFTAQPLSKLRGYRPGFFSFNVDGGRCPTCNGDGFKVVDMQFLADVTLVCEECKGKRFKSEMLDVTYKDKNIYDVLEMDIQEAVIFFADQPEIINRIQPLLDIGLGYVKLGQSSSSLSGGEAQRVKLASFLTKENRVPHTLFIFDEPTTGLHFDDVRKLLIAFNKLITRGNSIVIIEHNMDVLKNCDYIIDIGPEGGKGGGKILYQGSPEGLLEVKESYTAQYMKL
jgi:excinuclease ABC subunit A